MVGNVGRTQLAGLQHEHPRDVERDIAVADDDGPRAGEIELVGRVIRVAVVPGDELGGRVGTGAVLARDAQAVVARGTDRVDDAVVMVQQLRAVDVRAELDSAVEAEAFVRRRLLIDARDVLDLRMVGGNARAHESERGRQDIEEVDVHARVQQLLGGVEPCRPGSHDRKARHERRL